MHVTFVIAWCLYNLAMMLGLNSFMHFLCYSYCANGTTKPAASTVAPKFKLRRKTESS